MGKEYRVSLTMVWLPGQALNQMRILADALTRLGVGRPDVQSWSRNVADRAELVDLDCSLWARHEVELEGVISLVLAEVEAAGLSLARPPSVRTRRSFTVIDDSGDRRRRGLCGTPLIPGALDMDRRVLSMSAVEVQTGNPSASDYGKIRSSQSHEKGTPL